MASFKTSNVMDNEIIKASDFNFAFEQVIQNVSLASQMFLESNQDFIINGKVVVDTGMNVKVNPIFGVCKSTGVPFGDTDISDPVGFANSVSGRVDILEVQGEWSTYDNQQRAFNDPDTDVQTYQYVDTKKTMKPKFQVKQGVEGSSTAPEVDDGYVKIAEVVIRAGVTELAQSDIKNVTSDVAGLANEDWTTEPDITYNIGYISDVNARFRVQHNEDGTHKDNVINSDSLDLGTGAKQINGSAVPYGSSLTIPSQTAVSATDSLVSVITKAVAVITNLYNAYLKYGTYGFNGELSISSLIDGNNALVKPISISAAGDGTAVVKINGATVLTITASGQFAVKNDYAATATNHLVTKAVTDAISTALSNLTTRVTNLENTADHTVYSNGALSAGTDGRYNLDNTTIRAATTTNITLNGAQVVDGITPTGNDLILVKNQTDPKENGIYEYHADSAWIRPNSFDAPSKLKGKLFNVSDGTTNGKRIFYLPKVNFTSAASFGSDDINILEYFGSINSVKERLAMRDSDGCVRTPMPTSSYAAIPKIYVAPIAVNAFPVVITNGPTLQTNMSLTFFFTANITGTDKTTPLTITYNSVSYAIKAPVNGGKVSVCAHEISTNIFRYIDAFKTIQVIFDGTDFVVVGNPVVLSGSDYTIYADGQNSFLMTHPVGSIYWSSNSTNPQDKYGGTWTRITDTFIYAAGTNDTVDGTKFTKEVGADSVTLVQENLPDHHHEWSETTSSGTGHRHTIPTANSWQDSGYDVAVGTSGLPALSSASQPSTGKTSITGIAGKIKTTGNKDITQTDVDIRPKMLKRYCWERTA